MLVEQFGVRLSSARPEPLLFAARRMELVVSETVGEARERYPKILTPADVVRLVRAICSDMNRLDREHMIAIHLTTDGIVNFVETIAMGTDHFVPVHPPNVFRGALLTWEYLERRPGVRDVVDHGVIHGTKSLVLVHNHPYQTARPSDEDIEIFLALKKIGRELGGRVPRIPGREPGIEVKNLFVVAGRTIDSVLDEIERRRAAGRPIPREEPPAGYREAAALRPLPARQDEVMVPPGCPVTLP